MSSEKFINACKDSIEALLYANYNEDIKQEDLHLVWFSKNLQNFKCTMCDLGDNHRYYECTYNGDKQELYVDIYDKKINMKFIV